MSAYSPGLVSLIIPTIARKKTESLKTLIKRRYLLEDCLADIVKNVKVPYEVVLVLNGDEDPKWVEHCRSLPGVSKYLITSVNTGVPRGWNLGAQMAEGEYLCWVNDDVEIGTGSLERLIEVLNQDGVGEVGPAGTGWHRRSYGPAVGLERIEPADAISGFLFMTKRQIFDRTQGFDVNYSPAFMEEIDFSFQITELGLQCLVVPGLDIHHHHISGASSTNRPIRALGKDYDRWELTLRNQAFFEEKWKHRWKDAPPKTG